MPWILALVLLVCGNLFGATYYVATNGNNAAAGGLATPWSNIWYAAKTAVAGDTVNVTAGEYREFITNTVSGSAGSPIVFQGARGPGGEWLTVIDPGTPLTGWAAAAEIGAGVYKVTNSFAVREMTIGGKRVAFAYTNGNMVGAIENAYGNNTGLTNGADFLTVATDAIFTNANTAKPVTFWDGVKALYVVANTNTVYLRMRDGSDPSSLDIRGSPNREGFVTEDMLRPAIRIEALNYITWRDIKVRGAIACLWLSQATNNIIESNLLCGGYTRIYLGGDTNIARYNQLTTDYYGSTNIGAWGTSTNYPYPERGNLYDVSKFLMGESSSFDYNISVAGNNNTIAYNEIYQGLGTAVSIIGAAATPRLNTLVFSNSIASQSSIGVGLNEFEIGTQIHHNYFYDCNLNWRFQHMDYTGDTNRLVYCYRNRLWLPEGAGEHLYIFFYSVDTTEAEYPEYWVYHNSFLGGKNTISVSSDAVQTGKIPNCRFLNNILTGTNSSWVGNVGINFWTNAVGGPVFDYNLVTPVTYPASTNPVFFLPHNLTQANAEWAPTVTNFLLTSSSKARDSALDLTQPFTVGGSNYSALPFGTDRRIGSAWDMGALEAGTVATATTLRVGTLRGP